MRLEPEKPLGIQMTDLRQLAKETILKNIIDKLIFGLVAALIVFGIQKFLDNSQREKIEREAILRLDSGFVLNEAKILQANFSDYISVVTESISLMLPPTPDKQQKLLVLRVKIESSMEILSIHRDQIKSESTTLVNQLTDLNKELRLFDGNKTEQYQEDLNSLKKHYRSLLSIIKNSAISTLPNY